MSNIHEVSGNAAAERRARRKKNILENANRRIAKILQGPDGAEARQAPSIDAFEKIISFEETNSAEEAIHYVEPLYFELVDKIRFQVAFFSGFIMLLLSKFGILTNVVWPYPIICALYEIFIFTQKRTRYPKHGYIVNFLLCGGYNEEIVTMIGFLIDVLWEMMLDLMAVVIGFLSAFAIWAAFSYLTGYAYFV